MIKSHGCFNFWVFWEGRGRSWGRSKLKLKEIAKKKLGGNSNKIKGGLEKNWARAQTTLRGSSKKLGGC